MMRQSQRIDELENEVKIIQSHVSNCNDKIRELMYKQRESDSKVEQHRKSVLASLDDKFDALSACIKNETECRAQLAGEMQQLVRLKEQKLKQCFLNELNEETNARKTALS